MTSSHHSDARQTDDAAARQTMQEADRSSDTAAFGAYLHTLAELLPHYLELVALEGRLAALSVARMLAYGIGAALLVVTSWLVFMAALAVWLYHHGMTVESVLLGVSLLNGVLGVVAWQLAKRLSGNLLFSATRRQCSRSQPMPKGHNER